MSLNEKVHSYSVSVENLVIKATYIKSNPTEMELSEFLKVLYVAVYQLWWSEGYQDFANVESGVTTKV